MKREVGIQCGDATAKAFFRTVSVSSHEVLGVLEVDAKGAILEHPTALKKCIRSRPAASPVLRQDSCWLFTEFLSPAPLHLSWTEIQGLERRSAV